jgi:hypothetical protein
LCAACWRIRNLNRDLEKTNRNHASSLLRIGMNANPEQQNNDQGACYRLVRDLLARLRVKKPGHIQASAGDIKSVLVVAAD